MHIVPVIDLQQGLVVRALRGMRSHYRPIDSPLTRSADPLVVAQRLCEHCATDTIYVADLDALRGGTVQLGVLAGLLRALPRLRLWLDAGFASPSASTALLIALVERGIDDAAARVTPVFGSESLAATGDALPEDALLSLDSLAGEALDPSGMHGRPQHWPARVIVMTLDRVGSGEGPDLDTLAAVRRAAPGARLIASGGIRDAADLGRAAASGAEAWLVASALHDGRIGPQARRASADTDCRAAVREAHTLSQPSASLSSA